MNTLDGSARTTVVHLVWAPLGATEVAGFAAAYRAHDAGLEHNLVVLLNGFGAHTDPRLDEVRAALGDIPHAAYNTPLAVLDLEAYQYVVGELQAERVCFLNSYSRPLADGWLASLSRALDDPSVGMCGCGGSYESAFSSAPLRLKAARARRFARFPNPHLRTNAFIVARELMNAIQWPLITTKADAWAMESGRRSLSAQVRRHGLGLRVVGRDGVAYPPERWRESETFRSGDQRNLLIEDNRTRQYAEADPEMKRRLERMAWGKRPSAFAQT